MAERLPVVLIVEDDTDLAEMLQAYLRLDGYTVRTEPQGEGALTLAYREPPDLIVLDIRLPGMDGFEVCTRLQESHRTRHIPIIFLTERSERLDRLRGLHMGSVDYITKPFDLYELRLRVRNTLHRASLCGALNAVTGLPQGELITQALEQALSSSAEWGMLAVTLKGLRAFGEQYGFVAADNVLRVVGLTLNSAAEEIGGSAGFCGHLEEHTFALIVPAPAVAALRTRIVERLAGTLEYFYPADNRGPDAYTTDRLRLSIGALTARQGPFADSVDLIQRLLAAREDVAADTSCA